MSQGFDLSSDESIWRHVKMKTLIVFHGRTLLTNMQWNDQYPPKLSMCLPSIYNVVFICVQTPDVGMYQFWYANVGQSDKTAEVHETTKAL